MYKEYVANKCTLRRSGNFHCCLSILNWLVGCLRNDDTVHVQVFDVTDDLTLHVILCLHAYTI